MKNCCGGGGGAGGGGVKTILGGVKILSGQYFSELQVGFFFSF